MRNLLGRLHARSPQELTRIAAAWRVPLGAGDRARLVGGLYRALTDPRTVRDAWGWLTEEERAIVRLLAVGEETALSLAAIAAQLGTTEEAARETAAGLYRKGIVAREGDDEPLPVGVAPRLFLPRELAQLFRRVQDEIEAGDLSTTPLRALLSLLDDVEIDEAAQAWGLRVLPGLRSREEIERQLLERVGEADRVAAAAGARRRDAAAIWQRVSGEPGGAPVPLDVAAAAAGLGGDGPRDAPRLREALAELERALLVWHTYRPDGSRWLFVPAEIRAPRPPRDDELPALETVAAELVVPALRDDRPPHAAAWDLLTLLRDLSGPHAPTAHAVEELPRPWRKGLAARLWLASGELPPVGYVELLLALARAEGLVAGGERPDHEPLRVTAAVRQWRDRSFAEQSGRLRWWWQASDGWIEGEAREDVQVWGADWKGFRRRLLRHLGALAPGVWYGLESVAARVAARDPELLGSTFTAASARSPARAEHDAARRRVTIAEVVAITLETSAVWLGLVDLGDIPRRSRAIRVTPLGAAIAAGAKPPGEGEAEPRVEVRPTFEIVVSHPTPLQVWSLSAFADLARLGPTTTYRLTPRSLRRALEAGFDLRQITAFLTTQGGGPLPEAVTAGLAEWARGYRGVRLRRAVVLTPNDPEAVAPLLQTLAEWGFAAHRLGEAIVAEDRRGPGDDDPGDELLDRLREAGLSPQWAAAPAERPSRQA